MRKKFVLLLFLFCCISNVLFAQYITLPYECGFEDATEIGEWKLNAGQNGSKCRDQWMVGNLDMSGGFNSLYISGDNGQTITYGTSPNAVIAYRPVEVPVSGNNSTYVVDCSFDWKCVGEQGVSVLKFYFLPSAFFSSESEIASSYNSATLPRALRTMPPSATLFGSPSWNYWSSSTDGITFSLTEGEKWYMIFVWENNNKKATDDVLFAACVDNIQLSFTDCWKPENFQVEAMCDTIKVSWEGYNENYEFEYKKADARIWSGKQITKEKSIVLGGLGEGLYDVRVRGLCGDQKSAWVRYNGAVCYCPDRHCINFVTLDAEGVVCEVGTAGNLMGGEMLVGPSPDGPIDGRHTTMWKQNQYDPNTNNKLRTIPPGALASVRLGDSSPGGMAEGIKYEYVVDTADAKIILMKYAVVLQKPGHGITVDPGFILEIIDEKGNKIDPSCGVFRFTPEQGDFWHEYRTYVWKDWTSIGLNLAQYHGQKIYIHLVTQDCVRPTFGAHTGYAYFTLDCIDAAISNNSCGETVTIEMEAPEGFEYLWTNERDRNNVISNEQKIDVPANDITTYYCEVRYKGMPGCGFELHTKVTPRFAHASFDWEWKPENCENKVVFKNKSCVSTRVLGVETLTDEPCDAVEWRISNGEETSFEDWSYTFPQEGGTYDVTLKSYISGGACYDDTTVTIVVPPIYEHHDTISKRLCEGDVVYFDDRVLALPGEYVEHKKNIWGCDSITVLYLDVVPREDDVLIDTTICSADVYIFNGQRITKSGSYIAKLKNIYGCDSVTKLDIVVHETLSLDMEDKVSACHDDEYIVIPYALNAGRLEEYSFELLGTGSVVDSADLVIEDDAFLVKMPDNLKPNQYEGIIKFGEQSCGKEQESVTIDLKYSKNILAQRWGDVLAVKNMDYNGGYEFTAFQWFKNGEPIVGATSSVYYSPDGLDLSAEYSVLLTRASDGASVMTCVVDLEDYSNFEGSIVVVFKANDNVAVEATNNARLHIWSLQGLLVSELMINEGYNVIEKLGLSGLYLFEFIFEDGSREIKQVVL